MHVPKRGTRQAGATFLTSIAVDATTPAPLMRRIRAANLLRGEPTRRIAWYDTDSDGTLDLALEDRDADPEADVRFTLTASGRTVEEGVHRPWLRTGYLRFQGAANAALPELASLRG